MPSGSATLSSPWQKFLTETTLGINEFFWPSFKRFQLLKARKEWKQEQQCWWEWEVTDHPEQAELKTSWTLGSSKPSKAHPLLPHSHHLTPNYTTIWESSVQTQEPRGDCWFWWWSLLSTTKEWREGLNPVAVHPGMTCDSPCRCHFCVWGWSPGRNIISWHHLPLWTTNWESWWGMKVDVEHTAVWWLLQLGRNVK